MTIQDIRDLDEIRIPNCVDVEEMIQEHKMNNHFTIVTKPIARGVVNSYRSTCDFIFMCTDNAPESLLADDQFAKCLLNGGTVIADEINQASDDVLQFLIDLTEGGSYTGKFTGREYDFSNVHQDFKILGMMTPRHAND